MAIRTDIISIDWAESPRIIWINISETVTDVQDIYDTCRHLQALHTGIDEVNICDAGGKEPLGGGVSVGITVSLFNAVYAFADRPGPDWVICNMTGGNIVAFEDKTRAVELYPRKPTAYVSADRSSSSSATLQEQEAIQFASYNGAVTVDITSIYVGIEHPVGTPQQPVNNMVDAHDIAAATGIGDFKILSDMTIDTIDFSHGHRFLAASPYIVLTLDSSANLTNCGFENVTIQGEVDGMNSAINCFILDITAASGVFHHCAFGGAVVLTGRMDMFDCYSRVEGGGYPTFDVGAYAVVARQHRGSFSVVGATAGHVSSLGIEGGRLVLEASCVDGEVHARGTPFEIIDNSAIGCTLVDETESWKVRDIFKAHFLKRVWNKVIKTITIYEEDKTTPFKAFDTNDDLSDIDPQ